MYLSLDKGLSLVLMAVEAAGLCCLTCLMNADHGGFFAVAGVASECCRPGAAEQQHAGQATNETVRAFN
jgi:hypothetical protein